MIRFLGFVANNDDFRIYCKSKFENDMLSKVLNDRNKTGWTKMPNNASESRVAKLCVDKGLKMTEPRKVIAKVLSDSKDHPDVESLHNRVRILDPTISIATVYRTMKLFEDTNIVTKRDFGDGRARYEEIQGDEDHHHHLIDVRTGKVIEFYNEELERLKVKIANDLGYELVDHHLELFGSPINKN